MALVISLTCSRMQVVVELLPNNRLLRNGQRLGGHEALRIASLQAWGYSVVTVPCAEWGALEPTESPGDHLQK